MSTEGKGNSPWGQLFKQLRRFALVTVALAVPISMGACGSDGGPTKEPSDGDNGPVSVLLRDYEFVPKRLSFQLNQTVEFVLTSVDEVHTFTVSELGINWAVPVTDQPIRATFAFTQAGQFRLTCAIPSHEGLGMVGSIIVE